MDFAVFFACAAAIMVTGPRLVDAVEALAAHTGLGRLWLGAILLAGATSLPELVVATSAAALEAPDLALGTVLGSNMFNMLILGAALLTLPSAIRADRAAAGPGIAALALGTAALLFLLVADPHAGRVGLGASTLLGLYVLASFVFFRLERRRVRVAPSLTAEAPRITTLRPALLWLGGTTAVIFAASIFIADAAEGIAATLEVSGGVVGVIGVAFATSLPEVVTSISALRRGAAELATGNVFGSNIFNLAIIFPAELAFEGGSILRAASNDQAVTAAFGIGLMLVGLVALRTPRAPAVLRGIGAAMVVGYLAGAATIVALGIETG